MKKILLWTVALCLGFSALAQDNSSQILTVSFRAGLNGSSLLIPNSSFNSAYKFGYSSTQKMKLGAQAGLILNIRLQDHFSLQTGVMYSWQRFSQEQQSVFTDSLTSYSIGSQNKYVSHHIRVPLMLNYHFSTNPNHFVAGAGLFLDGTLGCTLAYDASAVVTTATDHGPVVTKYFGNGHLDPYKNERQVLYYTVDAGDFVENYPLYMGKMLKRIDLGVSLELGYQISKFYVGLGANFGLINMAKPEFFGSGFAQRNFSLLFNLGYNIN